MSDELATPNETEAPQTVSLEDYNAMIAERDALKANNESLIGEKRSATQKAADLEKQTQEAKEAQLKKEGDYEALMKIAQEKADNYERLTGEFKATQQRAAISKAAQAIGSELSDSVERVDALAGWAESYVSVNDSGEIEYIVDGIKVDKDKVKELLSSKYAWAIDGVKSSGGGATGGDNKSTNKKFNEYTGGELKAIKDRDPAEYERLKASRQF